jgi:hypothetical protein
VAKTNVTVYIPVGDLARLTELGLEPKQFVREAVKRALAELEQRQAETLADTLQPAALDLPPLTDEENQLLEEMAEKPTGDAAQWLAMAERASEAEPTPELDGWLERLRARAKAG